jgi:hypothetical protein
LHLLPLAEGDDAEALAGVAAKVVEYEFSHLPGFDDINYLTT